MLEKTDRGGSPGNRPLFDDDGGLRLREPHRLPRKPVVLDPADEDGAAPSRSIRAQADTLEWAHHGGTPEGPRGDELSLALDRALATLYMEYQPIVSWSKLRVVAYEALVRTREPSLERPSQLLAAAETLGRLPELGRAVRRNVALALDTLPDELSMFVNLHPRDLCDPDLFSPAAPLSAHAAKVVLEVTERESLEGFSDAAGHAAALRRLGFQLSVDDFGSGYSGLGSLAQVRPDYVRIDKELVRGVGGDTTKRKLIESAAALCSELGMRVVAEGVETAGERDALVGLGFDLMQGYLFGRPGPLAASLSLECTPRAQAASRLGQTGPRPRPRRRVLADSALQPVHRKVRGLLRVCVSTVRARVKSGSGEAVSRSSATTRGLSEHEPIDRIDRSDPIQEQLDCAPFIVVRVDHEAHITHVNEAWRLFARANGATARVVEGVGTDYPAALRGIGAECTAELDATIAELAAGKRGSLSAVYTCHSPTEARWFRLDGKHIAADESAMLIHTNVTDQHTAEARLRVQSVVAQSLAEVAPLGETCRRLARSICEGLEWDHAAIWLPDEPHGLRFAEAWSRPGRNGRPLAGAYSAGAGLPPGSLPERVWRSRAPAWIQDLRSDEVYRDSPAALAGMRTCFAVPLETEGEVFAVVECFGRIQRAPDQALLELLAMSGARIGAQTLQERAAQRLARAEAEQKGIRSMLDAIMQCVPASIIAVDADGMIRFVNRDLPPSSTQRRIGTDWLAFVPPDERDEHQARLRRVVDEGVSLGYETTRSRLDGTSAWLSSQLDPMREGDRIVGAVLVTNDVTEAKLTQADYIATQRLAAVGTMAAGVAHEINTPIQFVNDSIHFLRDAAAELLELVDGLKHVAALAAVGAPAEEVTSAVERAAEHEQTIDLAYLRDNVPKAIERCLDGLRRVTTIVRSLKEYAHPAQDELAAVDLNHAIESTLTIARGEYKYVADLESDFGDIPPVTCHVNDINQVVLNLVVNAAHAIGDAVAGTEARGIIKVRTYQEGERVVIAVSDTGTGVPDAIAHRIFEPFFTTKEVGKGTGQGLALAWAVVKNKHGGELSFDTRVGEGTTFFVRLPIHGKHAAASAHGRS